MGNCLTLKKSNCRNCYKCIRHCPVKSIKFTGDQAQIVGDECILCGQCFVVCPQNAKEIVTEVEKVKVLIQSGDPVVVSLAPSFIANYENCTIESMREAIKKLGFYDVEETAIGATLVKREYDRKLRDKTDRILISSCCHSVNLLIQKHYPELLDHLADTVSPMQAHAIDIKKRIPDARVVFIGPCVAKKDEGQRYPGIVDGVLTYEELTEWMAAAGVTPEPVESIEEGKDDNTATRLFPTAGGILKTMDMPEGYEYIVVDGTQNCILALEEIKAGNMDNVFIEMSACAGSCIHGPVMEKYHNSLLKNCISVSKYAGKNDFEIEQPPYAVLTRHYDFLCSSAPRPSEAKIQETLRMMGKTKPSDELNCGTCGYETCREKAIAVVQGKAEIDMCLPYLRDKAENFSNIIFDNTPNGLLVLNERFEIQQINPAACRILNIRRASDILGESAINVLDLTPFMDAIDKKKRIHLETYLSEYDKYVEETILYDESYCMIFCLITDISDRVANHERRMKVIEETTDLADKVVEKQMRIVQEIAMLLGETTAETKITLTKLKESIGDE